MSHFVTALLLLQYIALYSTHESISLSVVYCIVVVFLILKLPQPITVMQYSTPKNEARTFAAAAAKSPLESVKSPSQFASPRSFAVDRQKYENDLLDRPYLPDCWSDEKRMEVLFNPFRVRDTNPEGWDLKMNFWTNQINKWCLQQRKVVFTIDDLRKAFVRGDHHPHAECLKLVVSHMKRNQSLLLKEDLPLSPNVKSVGRNVASWTFNTLLVKPISLSWNLLAGNRDDISNEEKILPNINLDTKLFNKETLDRLTETVDSHIKNMKTTCMRYGNFFHLVNKNVFKERSIDEATFDILVQILESKGRVKTMEESHIRIIKFGKNIEINQTDITLIKLEATKEILEAEANKLNDQIEILREEAKQTLANKNRDKALLLLKRKKRMEAKLNEKDTQMDNIDLIYHQLLDSDSQQVIAKAFQMANDVLKRQSTNLEDIENTVAQVEDTLGDIASLTSEINRPIAGDNAAIELDAEEELDEILKDIELESKLAKLKDAERKELNEKSLLAQIQDLTIVEGDLSTESVKKADIAQPVAQTSL